MKRIKLTQEQYALVDDADYKELSKYKWHAHNEAGNFYALRWAWTDLGAKQYLSMHRQILGLKPEDKRQGDHRNHNTLDNRRSNIRICTPAQNQMNRKPQQSNTNQYKGVRWEKQKKKWRAQITINRQMKHLGYFSKEKYAAQAYNLAAKRYHKEFAFLNKIP